MRPSSSPGLDPSVRSSPLGDDLAQPFDDERPASRAAKAVDAPARPSGRSALPPSPVGAVGGYLGALSRWFLGAQLPVKVIAGSVVLVATLLAVIGIVGLTGGEERLYVDEKTALMTGPGSAPTYTKIAELRRGAELLVYDDGSIGDWVMVRDAMGRAGFVNAASLSDLRPVSLPGLAFAACAQSPIETGIEACQMRAQVQLDSCRSTCDGDADPTTCSDYCQKRFLACVRGCEGAAAQVAEIPTPSPTLDEPPPASPGRPANRVEPQPAKKKAHKRARRKKKRRR
jgi:hypothetical protein